MTRGPVPTVSVVVPSRDDAPALARCLALLAQQSVAPYEVVVVDNASTDDTAAVARAAGARVVEELLVGIPSAAAAGYDAARGEVIARLDADSRPGPRWVELVGRRMQDPSLDAATGIATFYDLPWGVRQAASWVYLVLFYGLTHLALGHTPVWGSNMAMRRSTWQAVSEEVHRDRPELHDDLDLSFVLGPRRRIRLDPTLTVGISGRSVRGAAQLRLRVERAMLTIRTNWALQPPWLRWHDRFTRPGSRAARRR